MLHQHQQNKGNTKRTKEASFPSKAVRPRRGGCSTIDRGGPPTPVSNDPRVSEIGLELCPGWNFSFGFTCRSYGWVGPIWPKQCASHSAKGLTSIPLWFFVLVLCKMLPLLPECSRATFAQNKKFYPQNVFWGPGLAVVTSPPYRKT
jgi:hypothetical protein